MDYIISKQVFKELEISLISEIYAQVITTEASLYSLNYTFFTLET